MIKSKPLIKRLKRIVTYKHEKYVSLANFRYI